MMFKKLENYILENEFQINILSGKIDVINYIDIDHFDSNKILIKYKNGTIIIKGEDLIISKLLTDEILIIGEIKSLEFV